MQLSRLSTTGKIKIHLTLVNIKYNKAFQFG